MAIPAAVEIETLFGSADHFIAHYGFKSQKTNTWNTEVFFGGRYTLTMQVETEIDYHANTLKAVSAPKFYLIETVQVDNPSGRILATHGANFVFSADDWRHVYGNHGDFSGAEKLPCGFGDYNENQSARATVSCPPRARKKLGLKALERKQRECHLCRLCES